MQDFFVVTKVYSNEFDCFVLEEVLKILALNVGMAYVVDQANVMYAKPGSRQASSSLRPLDPSLITGLWCTQHLAQRPTHHLSFQTCV